MITSLFGLFARTSTGRHRHFDPWGPARGPTNREDTSMISKDRMHVIVCHADPNGTPYESPIASAGFWRRADALAALDRLLGGPGRGTVVICDVGEDGSLRAIRERVGGSWALPSSRSVDAIDAETVYDLAPSTARRGM